MRFEKAKVQVKTNKLANNFNGLTRNFLKKIKRPDRNVDTNLPGYLDT